MSIQDEKISRFRLVCQSGATTIPGIDDSEEMRNTEDAMNNLGFEAAEVLSLRRCIFGLLCLGNVQFESEEEKSQDGSRVALATEQDAEHAARFLGLNQVHVHPPSSFSCWIVESMARCERERRFQLVH